MRVVSMRWEGIMGDKNENVGKSKRKFRAPEK